MLVFVDFLPTKVIKIWSNWEQDRKKSRSEGITHKGNNVMMYRYIRGMEYLYYVVTWNLSIHVGCLGRDCHQPNQINELHKNHAWDEVGVKEPFPLIKISSRMPGNDAARDSQLGRLCTRGVRPMDIILLKLYFIVKTQCSCRKCWQISQMRNLRNRCGSSQNFVREYRYP